MKKFFMGLYNPKNKMFMGWGVPMVPNSLLLEYMFELMSPRHRRFLTGRHRTKGKK